MPVDLDLATAARQPVAEVLRDLTTTDDGLTTTEAAARLLMFGENVLASHRVTAVGVLYRQLRNPLLILLVAAALVSAVTGDVADGVIIAAIVAMSVGLGFFNEYRSELAVASLQSNIKHEAITQRDGTQLMVDVRQLVPGDVVTLGVGALVPADVRLIEVNQLECDEALLTGESMPASKTTEALLSSDSTVDLASCAFMGTVVHQGSARAVVVATGSDTAFGKIALGLGERQAETAFQAGLRGFSKLLVGVAAVLTISIFVINVAFSRPLLEALLFSLAIAIGITPQLLPAIVSVSLASGSRQLARQHVLVKRLVTIEDLGNIEVLFTDKTGTLTEGAITFDHAMDANGDDKPELLALGLLCNEATMTPSGAVGGNALDVALWSAPAATEAFQAAGSQSFSRLGSLPFDHDRQLASVLVVRNGSDPLLVTKGAPEAVLARCLGVPVQAHVTLDRLFAEGARVVAVATRTTPGLAVVTNAEEHDLQLSGFLTFIDRPKAGIEASIAKLSHLGVVVKVITGDNGAVAVKVCRDIGMTVSATITGVELDRLDDDELANAIPGTTVFARVSPDQKSRIVKVARRTGVDVAFLGDGVNDAVALHAADVGISVESATDVAKDAADIVLLDKDLGVLADAITEGRRIFANTLKYVLMATSSNFGNMFSAAGASLFLSFLPMLPSQILLNNLLYDVGQLAIPTDHVDAEVLARPAAWDIGFVRKFMAIFGPISSIFDFLTFFVMLRILHASHTEFRSGWFVESLATQTLVVFVIRTRRVPFFRSRPSPAMMITPVLCALVGAILPFSPLAHVLGFTVLPLRFFLILGAMTALYLVLVETAKGRFYASQARPQPTPRDATLRHARHISRRARHFTHHTPPSGPLTARGKSQSKSQGRSRSRALSRR